MSVPPLIARDTARLRQLLDVAALRQEVIASNIANASTANYQRRTVRFEDMFREALATKGRVDEVEPRVEVDKTPGAGPNQNNVTRERELADLSANALRYELLARAGTVKLGILRAAIEGR
ncbi:MAG: hypothetical protein JKY65_31710 [Planctomycetes bacterium]|nr:hypothetical protein [Planctomycetota bacterium]